jgi:response regulator RpfG family c-di-GMP phosphodiesterase
MTSLTIAFYWHDVGLLMLPDQLLVAPPKKKTAEWAEYAKHPQLAADWLLDIAPEALEAAQIIRQHHQWANGFGIVAPQHADGLHQGAMMLACADLVYERVAGLSGEDYRRGMLRAVFDVNGGLDAMFDAPLINAFQAVARDFVGPAN